MNFKNVNLSKKVILLIKDFQIYKMHEVVIFLYVIISYKSLRVREIAKPKGSK